MATPSHRHDAVVQVRFWSAIWRHVRPHRVRIIGSAVCAAVVGVCVAIQPLCIKWIVDDGLLRRLPDGSEAPAAEKLHWSLVFIGVYIGFSALRMAVGLIGMRLIITGIESFLADLRGKLFRHIQHLCFRFHDRHPSGELFTYIMGSPLNSLKTFLHQAGLTVPIQVVSWSVAIVALMSFEWRMTLITLAIILIILLVNLRSRKVVRELSAELMETEGSVSRYVADVLRGSRAVKMYAIEDTVTGSFDAQVERIRTQGAALAWRQTKENGKIEALQYAGMAAIYLCGLWFVLNEGMRVGTFLAFVTSVSLLMGPLLALMSLNLVRANAEAGLERIERILATAGTTPEPTAGAQATVATAAAEARAAGAPAIAFRQVGFSYDGERPTLSGIDITIPHGQRVALVGGSGGGKTTFVSLLLRLYDPQQGAIQLNGVELGRYGLRDLRSAFGVVPQDPFIFQGTIRDNIQVVRPDASEAEVREAMRTALVDRFVDELPEGLDTRVGEGGSSLSGGQRQRLAIARCALVRPQFYVFDEATSALDNRSEALVQQAMEELMRGRTSFVIAHRLSTIRSVDRVLVFDHGRIVQDGAYDALAAVPGPFRDLLEQAHARSTL